MVQAYSFLEEISQDINKLDQRTISNLHAKLMKNSIWSSSEEYTAPGLTRNQTGQTVFISNHSLVQCCPYHLVDEELDLILSRAKVAFSVFYLRFSCLRFNLSSSATPKDGRTHSPLRVGFTMHSQTAIRFM